MTRTEDGDRALAERITAQVVPALASGIEVDERSESLGDRALTIWRHLEPHVHVRASARAAVQAVAAAPRDADARAALCFEVRKLLREQPSLAEEVSALFNDSSVPSAALVVSGAASVVITGDVTNSTILVGGDNTVQQFFGHHVSPKLARQDFTPELGRGEGLVGRRWIFDALERRSRASECGYFEILGAAGLGKTALAAAIAQRYGAAAFFASRFVRAADTCLNHLSAELIRSHGLPDRPLPIAVEQAATVFTHLLAEAAEGAKKKVWIVVDGLDEADPAGGVNPLRLPSRLPPGVFIVVTGRPGSPRLRIPRELRLGEYTLEWDSAEQQSDIEAYVRREATASDAIVSALGASSPPINVDAFVQRLLMQSHGNFAYLSFLLPDIADRAARHEPIELDALPDGLHEYYASEWERIEASGRLAGPQAWSLSYRPVIELLAVAEEPVTVAWLADHTGCPPGDIRTWAIRSWERFLICDRRREPETWRLAHQSFADFLAASTDQRDGDVSIPDAHRRVASYYLTDRLRRNAHGGYALRHLSSHLRAAAGGLPGEQGAAERARLFSLVDTLDWYQVQTRGDASGAMYLKDLENAWRAAEHANATEAKGPLTCLGREIRSAVFIASLRSRFQNIPPVLLGALVTYGQWNAVHALEVARQNPDPVGRAIASALVMDHLPASEHRTVADEVLSRARSISTDDWTRKIQYGFVPRIPQELAEELRRRGAVDRALVNANAVADVQLRSHLLACVIPLLVDPLQGDVVRQVLKQAVFANRNPTVPRYAAARDDAQRRS